MSNSIRKQLLKAGMLAKAAHDGVYASDHYPIGLQLILQ
jgi:hypothetical protein